MLAYSPILTSDSVQFLRDVKTVFGTSFKISAVDDDKADSELLLSCYGTGFINVNRTIA